MAVADGSSLVSALQLKLTTVIFVPALAADYLVRRTRLGRQPTGPRADGLWKSSHEAMAWCAVALLTFGAVVLATKGRVARPADAL
jgi:hypothetical protein